MLKQNKGMSNLISFVLFTVLSIAVIATIFFLSQGIIQKNQELYEFEEMIKNINLISNTIDGVSQSRFSSKEVTIFNPDTLIIDCENNEIFGQINYTQEIRDDVDVFVGDIEIKKSADRLSFKKPINYNTDINVSCNTINFNKGKTRFIFSYNDFIFEQNQINLLFTLLDLETKRDWHYSSWRYRQLITIDHTKIDDDLYDFKFLFNDFITFNDFIKEDGSDIIFVNLNDDTIFEREIIDYNPATGKVVALVNIPYISSIENTKFYVYYGNLSYEDEIDVVDNNLILWFNSQIKKSYPGSGDVIFDLARKSNWTFDDSLISFNEENKSFHFSSSQTGKSIITDDTFKIESDTNSLTYYFYAKLTNPFTNNYPTLFFDRSQGSGPFVWIYTRDNLSLNIQYSHGEGYSVRSSSNYFLNHSNEFIQIAISFKYHDTSPEIKFYRNGSLINTVNFSTKALFPSEITTKRFGSYNNGASHNWKGDVIELKLYNKILSEETIKAMYENEILNNLYNLEDIEYR